MVCHHWYTVCHHVTATVHGGFTKVILSMIVGKLCFTRMLAKLVHPDVAICNGTKVMARLNSDSGQPRVFVFEYATLMQVSLASITTK
jgi:hypothetical protein